MTTIVYLGGKLYTDNNALFEVNEANYFYKQVDSPKVNFVYIRDTEASKPRLVAAVASTGLQVRKAENTEFICSLLAAFDTALQNGNHSVPLSEKEALYFRGRGVIIATHNGAWHIEVTKENEEPEKVIKAVYFEKDRLIVDGSGCEFAIAHYLSGGSMDEIMKVINRYDTQTSPVTYVIDLKNVTPLDMTEKFKDLLEKLPC